MNNDQSPRAGDGNAEAAEREAFEAWITSVATFEDDNGAINLRYLALHKHYVDFDVDRAWLVWQARAALAAAPAAAPAVDVGPKLFAFATHGHWVMNAPAAWKRAGVRPEHTLCIDAKGRHCFIGRDFRIAKEDDAFPVTVHLRRADLAAELGFQAPATADGSKS